MKCFISLNIKVISQYQFVCTRLSSAHTPTRKLVGVWALEKLVHTNRYCEITLYIYIYICVLSMNRNVYLMCANMCITIESTGQTNNQITSHND